MHKLIYLVALSAILMNGCAAQDQPQQVTDNRINDPNIIAHDVLLDQGDLGVEAYLEKDIKQDASKKGSTLRGASFRGFVDDSPFPGTGINPAIDPKRGDYANNVISFGRLFLGTPYEFGSDRDEPDTFDCSDFTRYAFLGALGLEIPMDSRSQADFVKSFGYEYYTDLRQAQRGDLLFFMDYEGYREEDYDGINPRKQRISHVGIYMGDGKMLHTASKKTGGVRMDYIYDMHLEWRFVMGGRILP